MPPAFTIKWTDKSGNQQSVTVEGTDKQWQLAAMLCRSEALAKGWDGNGNGTWAS